MSATRAFRILVLDDEPEILTLIGEILGQEKGLEVVMASNAQDAIKCLPRVDAVLADCLLPEILSFEQVVKRMGKPMIRMSGAVLQKTNLEITKPFSSRQIRESVELLKFFHSGVSERH